MRGKDTTRKSYRSEKFKRALKKGKFAERMEKESRRVTKKKGKERGIRLGSKKRDLGRET